MKKSYIITGVVLASFVLIVGGCAKIGSKSLQYKVTLTNVSQAPVSPGVYAVHGTDSSWNWQGQISPESLEPLAEYGDHTAFLAYAQELGAHEVISVDEPIMPGEIAEFIVETPYNMRDGLRLSGYQMYVPTNDAVTFFDSIKFESGLTAGAIVLDNGTEENEPLGRGFASGQPDPAQGDKNIENGVPTDPQADMSIHEQVDFPVLRIHISQLEVSKDWS